MIKKKNKQNNQRPSKETGRGSTWNEGKKATSCRSKEKRTHSSRSRTLCQRHSEWPRRQGRGGRGKKRAEGEAKAHTQVKESRPGRSSRGFPSQPPSGYLKRLEMSSKLPIPTRGCVAEGFIPAGHRRVSPSLGCAGSCSAAHRSGFSTGGIAGGVAHDWRAP